MSIKKTTFITVFISAIFVSASFMVAQAYEPLVRLPGLPTEGTINLSQYVVGLYNFLLSIVGIVAVMMLIIGGMKYITAAGNASVIGDAKDTISSAIFGLLLALLSWVIVSTINPDVLFIKNPASSLVGGYTADHGACGEWDGAVCTCNDESVPTVIVASENECKVACSDPVSCELTSPTPCAINSNEPFIEGGVETCLCADSNKVTLSSNAITAGAKCDEVCSNPNFAEDNKYHGVKIVLDIFTLDDDNEMIPISKIDEETFTLKINKDYFFDFSDSYDCKGEIVSFAIELKGGKPNFLLGDAPDRWCCMIDNPACPSTWGECCNAGGCLFLFKPYKCDDSSCSILSPELCTYFEPNEDNSNYPIYKVSYSSDGTKKLWTGVTNKTSDGGIKCYEDTEKVFSVRVEN